MSPLETVQEEIDFSARYPRTPGHQDTDTSKAAAAAMKGSAGSIRAKVLETLVRFGPLTPDEVAALCGESILTIRPRFTELKRLGKVEDSGQRRLNRSGRFAAVMQVAPGGAR